MNVVVMCFLFDVLVLGDWLCMLCFRGRLLWIVTYIGVGLIGSTLVIIMLYFVY